jgi:hypothetical protein
MRSVRSGVLDSLLHSSVSQTEIYFLISSLHLCKDFILIAFSPTL